jgi:hypothetical protein
MLRRAAVLGGTAMTDAFDMSHGPSPIAPRAAAIRMVAAAEYFKAAGELPSWARNELESWGGPDAVDVQNRFPGLPRT